MNDVSVRVATEADRQQLEQLIADCYEEIYPNWYGDEMIYSSLTHVLRLDPLLLQDGHYFAAQVDGELAGCGGWGRAANGPNADNGSLGHLRHFATHPNFMRRGVGAVILEKCVAAAKADGISALHCFSSVASERFYLNHGFTKVQDVSVMLGGDEPFPAILMERKLG
ncbi:MAG: GNAT family N-acetyltransferase [Hyphomicrobiaceae bacterium]|nr:GNAT family N-acetyltransferase [Hyphomicrobiaceae bacterium]MCC0022682.1 GNAT family N-acetyltransferase [Hyphomicrobiaceae bacterium]